MPPLVLGFKQLFLLVRGFKRSATLPPPLGPRVSWHLTAYLSTTTMWASSGVPPLPCPRAWDSILALAGTLLPL
jgi:hypothetical protein